MGNFTTGIFALLGAFGGIYLKDYLEQKNSHIKSTRQKAVEAYALTNKVPFTFTSLVVLCKYTIRDPHNSHSNSNENWEKTMEILEKLELLIIENFINLNPELISIRKEVINMGSLLIDNILTPSISEDELETK